MAAPRSASPRAATPTPDAPGRATPRRSCVGCREVDEKGALVRIVRGPDGSVALDRRGSAPGRGVYVHRERGCVERAMAKGATAVFRALRARSDLDAAARLKRDIEGELAV